MIILADSPNSKGAQLENLTLRLLQNCNYQNCTANVMANGAEIDVRGKLPLPGFDNTRTQELICECKAHKAAIDMTQWCKFLGKILHQETVTEAEIAGCFISLSGVNGHVQGHYDEFRRHSTRIMLMQGEELLSHISEFIPIITLQEMSQKVRTLTPRVVSRFEPAYHNGAIYWITVFSAGEFTIFDADGQPIEDVLSTDLVPLVESELDVSSYVNIRKEQQSLNRVQLARTLVVATLFIENGSIQSVNSFVQIEDFTPQELAETAQRLIEEGHLHVDEDGQCFIPIVSVDYGEIVPLELYRILFRMKFPIQVLASEFYQQRINHALLFQLCNIQQGLPVRETDVEELIYLLRLSPSALVQALYPMQMIVTARQQDHSGEFIDRFHQDYFRQAALQAFKRDFRNSAMALFYHEHEGLREMETTTVMTLKSSTKIVSKAEFTERVGIGRADESIGGGFVHVAMLSDAPQPWDE